MSRVPTASGGRVAKPSASGSSLASWGGPEQQQRVFAALHASLAQETLPALPTEVLALVPVVSWGQIAETMRLTRSKAWRNGLTVATTAVPHQVLWLLVGGEAPSPRGLKGRYHRAFVDALIVRVEKPFESEVDAEDHRVRMAGGNQSRCLQAARVTVASRLPWSAPADLSGLRALMADPSGAAAQIGGTVAALRSSAATAPRTLHAPPRVSMPRLGLAESAGDAPWHLGFVPIPYLSPVAPAAAPPAPPRPPATGARHTSSPLAPYLRPRRRRGGG